jgi:hypothetical protein
MMMMTMTMVNILLNLHIMFISFNLKIHSLFSDDDDVDYTGLSLLSGDIFEDLLGDDGDSDSKPAKKSSKKKKKPVSDLDNEVDAALSDDDEDDDGQSRPAGSNNNKDDDESEEESDGILGILDGELITFINNNSRRVSLQQFLVSKIFDYV